MKLHAKKYISISLFLTFIPIILFGYFISLFELSNTVAIYRSIW